MMIEKERPQRAYKAAWLLGLIIVLGAVLRLIGIRFGLPMAYHNDEWVLVLATQQFYSGDFNPHNFLYPSFLMYIMYLVERIYFLFFSGRDDLSTLYVICRVTVVLFALASIWATYRLGRKLHDERVGLIAALLLAVSHLHVVNSHFATTDVPLTFFLMVTLWSSLLLLETRSVKSYLIAGLLLGCTVSIKIPGAVVVVPILTAHLYAVAKNHQLNWLHILSQEWRAYRRLLITACGALLLAVLVYLVLHFFEVWARPLLSIIRVELWIKFFDEIAVRVHAMAPKLAALVFAGVMLLGYTVKLWWPEFNRILLLFALMLVAFFVTTPYAILDFKAFFHDFLFQMVISQSSWSGMFAEKAPGYITNMTYLRDDFGLVLLLTAGAGVVLGLVKRRIYAVVIFTFAITYYFYIGSWRLMFPRYMVPMLPLLGIWAGFAMVRGVEWLRGKLKHPVVSTSAASLLLALLLVYPGADMFRRSYSFDRYLLKTNTKKLAYDWAVEHLPKQALILREQYTPELELAGYPVHNVNFTFEDSVTVDYVHRHRADYIIVSDKLWKRPVQKDGVLSERKAYADIANYADLIYHIKPTPQNPGPEIKIFKVKCDSTSAREPVR